MTNEERWFKYYSFAKEYYKKYENLLVPQDYVVMDEDNNEVNLGSWIMVQRRNYNKKKLSISRINLLNEIGMIWKVYKNNKVVNNVWMKKYKLAKKYYEEHKNLRIPPNYIVIDENEIEVNLYEWIENQKRRYKDNTLNKKQIKLLNKIKIIWEIKNNDKEVYSNWLQNYNYAKEYYKKHKNLLIPQNYIIIDKNKNEINLGMWIREQRRRYKNNTLNIKQIELLNKIAMVWTIFENDELISDKWLKNYKLAKSYYNEHNNLLIPATYVVKDEDGKDVKLGHWINTQRRAYKGDKNRRLTEKQICLLDEIDMVYNVRYYKTLVKQLDMEYDLYQYGLLDNKNIEELVENKHLVFEDSNKIIKGNAIVLSKKLVA